MLALAGGSLCLAGCGGAVTTTTTTVASTTTTKPLSPGFSSHVSATLRAAILKVQPNVLSIDTFVSIVKGSAYPSWVEVCAQDAGPASPGPANGFAHEVTNKWIFTGFGTAWGPPFTNGLTQAIVDSFGSCP